MKRARLRAWNGRADSSTTGHASRLRGSAPRSLRLADTSVVSTILVGRVLVWLLGVVFLVLVHAREAQAQPAIDCAGQSEIVVPPASLEVLHDSTGKLGIADVSSSGLGHRFHEASARELNPSFTHGAVWFRLRLRTSTARVARILDLTRAWVEQVTFYVQSSNGDIAEYRSGANVPFTERPVPHERSLLSVNLEAGQEETVYVRLAGAASIAVRPVLYSPERFRVQEEGERLWFGAFFGILGFFAIYNLLLFASLRESNYVVLSAFLTFYGLGELATHGFLGRYMHVGHVWGAARAGGSMIGWGITALCVFTTEFLDLPTRYPAWNRALRVLAATLFVASTWCAFDASAEATTWWCLFFVALFITLASARTLSSGQRQARLFAFAVGPFVGSATVPLAEIHGFVGLSLLTEHFAHIGALVMSALLSLGAGEKVLRLQRGAARFVPMSMLAQLGKRSVADVRLGDHVDADMVVMFTDLRNFTTFTEKRSAKETFHFLNQLLGKLVPHVRANGGVVDKYVGDAIMALFPEGPASALRAATAMQAAIADWNAGCPKDEVVEMGVGLHAGHMMLGTVGESERFDATVISDTVNLASRLESLSKTYGAKVIVSEEIVKRLPDSSGHLFRRLGTTRVKGRSATVTIFEALDAEREAIRAARAATRERFESAIDALQGGRRDAARIEFRAVLEADPGDTVARHLLDGMETEVREAPSSRSSVS